jgi:hypothetical protein
MRILDPGWKKFGSGIREHPGSATLTVPHSNYVSNVFRIWILSAGGKYQPYYPKSFAHVGKSGFFKLVLFTAVPIYVFFYLFRHIFHNFQYFGQYIEIFWKKVKYLYFTFG